MRNQSGLISGFIGGDDMVVNGVVQAESGGAAQATSMDGGGAYMPGYNSLADAIDSARISDTPDERRGANERELMALQSDAQKRYGGGGLADAFTLEEVERRRQAMVRDDGRYHDTTIVAVGLADAMIRF